MLPTANATKVRRPDRYHDARPTMDTSRIGVCQNRPRPGANSMRRNLSGFGTPKSPTAFLASRNAGFDNDVRRCEVVAERKLVVDQKRSNRRCTANQESPQAFRPVTSRQHEKRGGNQRHRPPDTPSAPPCLNHRPPMKQREREPSATSSVPSVMKADRGCMAPRRAGERQHQRGK